MTIAALRESVIRAGLDASGYEAGARKVQAANQNMAASGDRVAAAQEKLTRTTAGGASAIERLSRELDRSFAAQQRFERAQRQIDSAMGRGLVSQQRGAELLALARERYLGVAAGAEQAATATGRFSAAGSAAAGALSGMSGSLGMVGTALAALGPVGIAAGVALGTIAAAMLPIARAGDQATATLARLTAATGSIDAARTAYEGLYQVSLRTGVSVADSAGTFQRFRIAAGEIGATNAQVLQLVEGLQKAAVVSGAVGQEGAAAMMQLGQALAAGKLNGDELRSLLENMPSLAQRLAEELGTNIGALRKMGEEGQLTADRVFPALLRATDRMAADFDRMPLTMERAFNILGNAMTRFVEQLDEALGLSQLIAKAAKAAADAVDGARRSAMPTPAESADRMVAEGQRQIAAAQARLSGAEAEIAQYQQQGLTRDQAIGLAVPTLPGAKAIAKEMAEGEALLRRGLQAQSEIRAEAAEAQNRNSEEAARKAAESQRAAAEKRAKERETELFKEKKLEQEHAKQLKEIAEDLARGGLTDSQAARQRAQVNKQYAEDLKKLRDEESREGDKATKRAEREAEKEAKARDKVIDKLRVEQSARERMARAQAEGEGAVAALSQQIEYENALREAGIPITGARTDEEERLARAIWDTLAATDAARKAEKSIVEAREASKRELDRINRDIESQARRVSDDVATGLYEGLIEGRRGQTVLATFGNLFKRIAIQAASTQIFLPITTAVMGAVPQLFGIGGGGAAGGVAGGGIMDLLGLSSLLPKDGIMSALGLGGSSGWMAGMNATLFGTPAAPAFAGGPMAGVVANPGTAGILGSGGAASLMGIAGAAGLGFGAGSLLNSMLGRSSAQSTNGTIGAGVGSALGVGAGLALDLAFPGLGTLVTVLGGLAGGGLGGLFGPGESVRGYGYGLEAGPDGLLKMGATFYNEEGEAAFREAEQGIAAMNDWLGRFGITVGGAASVGGNRNGPDYSNATAGSFRQGVSQLYYHASDPTLQAALSARGNQFGDVAEMQKFVEGFQAIQAVIKELTAEPVPAFTQQMNTLTAQYDAAIAQAREYGLAEDGLAAARARAIADLEAERAEYLRQVGTSLEVRRLRAQGRTMEAELAQQAEEARQQLAAATADLERWAISAAEKSRLLTELEAVQAAERADIIARYGEQAAAALRQAGGSIRAWLDNLASGTAGGASPADRLSAAQQTFNRDRVLAMGGDRDALGRITGAADALLGAGRDMFASGAGFQALKNEIVGALGNLPVVQSYDAMQTAALEAIQQQLEMGTLLTAISPGLNGVTIVGGLSLAPLEQLLAQVNASTLAVGDAINRQINSGTQTALDVGRVLNQVIVGQTAAIVDSGAALNRAINGSAAATLDVGNTLQRTLVQQGAVTTEALAEISAWLGGLGAYAAVMSLDLHMLRAGLTTASQIAVDASAANVTALGTLSRIAADASAAQVAAQNAGNSIAVMESIGNASRARAITESLAAVHAATSAGNTIAVDAARASTESLAAMNRILVDASAAATAGAALTNVLLMGLRTAAANDNLLGPLQNLVQLGQAIRGDVQPLAGALAVANNWLATLRNHAVEQVSAQGVGNRIAADASAAQVLAQNAGNSLIVSVGANHSALLGGINASVGTVDSSVVDVNTSLGTLDRSARDINASLATVHAAISAGNTIAVDAANASTTSFAAANTIAVDSSAAMVTALASIATQIAAANQHLASLEAKLDASNTIAATGHQILATTTRDTLAITNGELARANTTLRQLVA